MMKTVVLDGRTLNPGDNPWDELEALGPLEVYQKTVPEELLARSRNAEILLTNKTLLDNKALAALPRLRFISVLATGYNVVDLEAARRYGVQVSNVPTYGTSSVAQHTFALLLALCHQVQHHDADVRSGAWAAAGEFCFWRTPPIELEGLTMGIIGFGRIGQRVARLAEAFGMRVLVNRHDQSDVVGSMSDSGQLAVRTRAALFSESDVVSLHCPLTEENHHFVNEALLARMKPTAYLINTARGGLVDEVALADALKAGRLGGAGLDVVSTEPIDGDNPLLSAPRCVITPHMAWGSLAARRRLMMTTVENVKAYRAGAAINLVS